MKFSNPTRSRLQFARGVPSVLQDTLGGVGAQARQCGQGVRLKHRQTWAQPPAPPSVTATPSPVDTVSQDSAHSHPVGYRSQPRAWLCPLKPLYLHPGL